jgi:hypothetical protein
MPPVYVAITRCIELAGGQMMFVQQKDSGRKRYAVRLSGLVTLTNLNRVLFDVPPAPRLYERADADYHDIAPSTYHVSAGPSRADVIRAVTERDAALGSLLQDLFALADLWHDDELTA